MYPAREQSPGFGGEKGSIHPTGALGPGAGHRPASEARIMLVDGHPLARAGIRTLLSQEEALEVCAETGSLTEILPLLKKHRPNLLILELSLCDGFNLGIIKRIRKASPHTPILVCTIHPEAAFARRALMAGALGYINKSEPPATLVAAISSVRAGKRHVGSAFVRQVFGNPQGASQPGRYAILDRLTDREIEVFTLIGQGLSSAGIAPKLCISAKTVASHRQQIINKLDLKDANAVARYAVRWFMENH